MAGMTVNRGVMKGRDSMTPPRSRINIGSGDFHKMGQEFKVYFIDLADLQPHHKVLDVGCGIGRMAAPAIHHNQADEVLRSIMIFVMHYGTSFNLQKESAGLYGAWKVSVGRPYRVLL